MPGSYGDATHTVAVTFNAQGQATSATAVALPGISTSVAKVDVDNNWSHAQTSQSSWTVLGNFSASNIVATGSGFTGIGSGLTGLSPYNMATGALTPGVTIDSGNVVGLPAALALKASLTGATFTGPVTVSGTSVTANSFYGDGSHLTNLPSFTGGNVANTTTFQSSVTVKGAGILATTVQANSLTATPGGFSANGFSSFADGVEISGGDLTIDSGGINALSGTISGLNAVLGGGSLASGDGLTVNGSSATVAGLIHVGWEHINAACSGGFSTCTATCSAGKYAMGGACSTTNSSKCNMVAGNNSMTCNCGFGDLTADVYCSRIAP
jgi:hypothetical protein